MVSSVDKSCIIKMNLFANDHCWFPPSWFSMSVMESSADKSHIIKRITLIPAFLVLHVCDGVFCWQVTHYKKDHIDSHLPGSPCLWWSPLSVALPAKSRSACCHRPSGSRQRPRGASWRCFHPQSAPAETWPACCSLLSSSESCVAPAGMFGWLPGASCLLPLSSPAQQQWKSVSQKPTEAVG